MQDQGSNAPGEAEITRFLSDPASYAGRLSSHAPMQIMQTHAARIFLLGEDAFKVKKHVRLPYLDFTTLDERMRVLARELELNQPAAPEIYLELLPIRRAADGALSFEGSGTIVDVALHMRRFAQEDVLSQRALQGRIDRAMAKNLAEAVLQSHEAAPIVRAGTGIAAFHKVIDDVQAACAQSPDETIRTGALSLAAEARSHLARLTPLLRKRAEAGFRRRCHGDLHLGNLVLWQGRPVLFDALEFDEELASIDILYDLAFLLMDLQHVGLRDRANDVLNSYLWRADPRHLDGLAALPLFMALRAGIRCMVALHQLAGMSALKADAVTPARAYLSQALSYLTPTKPCLIAVGGLSGSGKSTLAAALAPQIASAAGAVHVRSDLERKALHGVGETERLPQAAYAREMSAQVYAVLNSKAKAVIAAGYPVIVDAVHAMPAERAAIARVAEHAQVPFIGLWLDAPPKTLADRVAARVGDASDATAEVVTRQLDYDLGPVDWHRISAGGSFETTLDHALCLITPFRFKEPSS